MQELQFSSRTHARLTSSYQIDFPPDLLRPYLNLERTETANVLLPLTTRRKAPLLNFALSGPGGSPAALTSRVSTAGLQCQYLVLLGRTSDASDALHAFIPAALYEAIGVFTPGRYERRFLKRARGDHDDALVAYLRSGLRSAIDPEILSPRHIARWREKTRRAGAILVDRLGEPPDELSCSEELLLALPHLDPLPECPEAIDAVVEGYLAGVEAADRAADEGFLSTLAEYGRRYEMVVEVEVPLLEPSTIKIEEDLPLEIARGLRTWTTHEFPLRDARSVHLEARVLDPGVEIANFQLHDLEGADAGGWIESVRHTREALAIYASEPARPYHARLRLRLTGARYVVGTALALTLANMGALIGVLLIEQDGAYVDRLAILAIPTTVAAAVVLIREQTALAIRLQWRGARMLLAFSTLILWVGVVVSVVAYDSEERLPDSRPDGQAQSSQSDSGVVSNKE